MSGLCKDGHLTPGGGATEIELARQVSQWAETHPGLEQYSINKFAEALEIIPRVLAENSGVKPKEVISKLYAAHSEGNKNMGFDIDGESADIIVSIIPFPTITNKLMFERKFISIFRIVQRATFWI